MSESEELEKKAKELEQEVKNNKMEDTIFSITAHMDLLGFSSHLILGNYDIRTKIGCGAIERLKVIENAIDLFEKEKAKFPEIYPINSNLSYFRFNDSLFLGIDLREDIIPRIGEVNLTGGVSISYFEKMTKKKLGSKNSTKKFYEFYAQIGFEVAKFVGLVSRIHNFINAKERENNFPGCRTVISSGLRKKYIDRSGKDDFLSANFSLANAYLTNKKGKKEEISGSGLYLEDNVARAIRYDEYCKSILSHSKYINKLEYADPYENSIMLYDTYLILAKKIKILLFEKEYCYRNLNSNVLSIFQLLPPLKKYLEGEKAPSSYIENLVKSISETAPPLHEMHDFETRIRYYPLFSLVFGLDEDLKETMKVINKKYP